MTTPFRPQFPLVWDNSMRSAFVECPQKMLWEYIHHFKSPYESIHLHAGKAWATALETTRRCYYQIGQSPTEAIATGMETLIREYGDFIPPESGSGSNKSLDRMLVAFAYYWQAFPLKDDPVQPYSGKNGPMIEFSFASQLAPDLLHPETGEPIIFAGRADMVATYAGAVSVYDDKTTSSLGNAWAGQWDRRAQFTGYTWAAQQAGIPVTQCVVRGIAILKTKIDHAQVLTTRTPKHIAEWHKQICRDIRRAIECWKEGYWDVNIADACSSFGGCQFKQPCGANDPMPWLESSFVRREWNPVTREDSLIEEGKFIQLRPSDLEI
jgi:hypothetical protein